MLVLALLMPIATTVVWYHGSFRRKRLLVVLLAGFLSTVLSLVYVSRRRDPIVSYATRERVRLRTAAAPTPAHRALRKAVAAALNEALKFPEVEGDGGVEGLALERASELPPGAFRAMRRAAGANAEDAALWAWPDELGFDDHDEPRRRRTQRGPRGVATRASADAGMGTLPQPSVSSEVGVP